MPPKSPTSIKVYPQMDRHKRILLLVKVVLAVMLLLFLLVTTFVLFAPAVMQRSRKCDDLCRSKIEGMFMQHDLDIRLLNPENWQIARPHDMKIVHSQGMFVSIIFEGNVGMGESYMAGKWKCDKIDELYYRILSSSMVHDSFAASGRSPLQRWIFHVCNKAFNMQNPMRSWRLAEVHYDLGNDLYTVMLDRRMVYSCGYWIGAKNLDEAQENKLELVCKKVGLHKKPNMKVIDLGCGWGSFMEYAAEKYSAHVTGLTVSKEQVLYGENRRASCPTMKKKLQYHLQDYRDVMLCPDLYHEKFDAVVSIGSIEHVGLKNYRKMLDIANFCLKPGGLMLIHGIGVIRPDNPHDMWIRKYIFPNGYLPSVQQFSGALESTSKSSRLILEDVENFGPCYDKTLMAWNANFQKGWREHPNLRQRYGPQFKRMWEFYLLICAAAFRARTLQLYQFVVSKGGVGKVRGIYTRPCHTVHD